MLSSRTGSGSQPSFAVYAFDLRQGLRDAARTSLNEFESLINEVGYGWLEGYIEGVMEGPSK
jgi:hypothetical protein